MAPRRWCRCRTTPYFTALPAAGPERSMRLNNGRSACRGCTRCGRLLTPAHPRGTRCCVRTSSRYGLRSRHGAVRRGQAGPFARGIAPRRTESVAIAGVHACSPDGGRYADRAAVDEVDGRVGRAGAAVGHGIVVEEPSCGTWTAVGIRSMLFGPLGLPACATNWATPVTPWPRCLGKPPARQWIRSCSGR